MNELGRPIAYKPRYAMGQNWGGIFSSLVDAYGNYTTAEAAEAAAEATEAAARAQTIAAQTQLEAERLRLQAQREARAGDLIPGVPNMVTYGSGVLLTGGLIWAIFG